MSSGSSKSILFSVGTFSPNASATLELLRAPDASALPGLMKVVIGLGGRGGSCGRAAAALAFRCEGPTVAVALGDVGAGEKVDEDEETVLVLGRTDVVAAAVVAVASKLCAVALTFFRLRALPILSDLWCADFSRVPAEDVFVKACSLEWDKSESK